MSELEQDEAQTAGESQAPIAAPPAETPDQDQQDQPVQAQSGSNLPPVQPTYDNEMLNDLVRDALQPVSAEHPCGQSEDEASSVVSQIETTADSIHEALRTAFGDAVRDDNMSSFDMSGNGRDADELIEQIVTCLKEKCKSLVLASYLPHLMLIIYGLEGFDAGLMIFREIVQRFPDQRFPRDNEKLAGFLRRGVYVGNDDKVTDNFKLFLYLPITEPGRLSYALLRNARVRGADGDIEGKYSTDAAKSSPQFYDRLISDLNDAIVSAKLANQAIGGHLGDTLFEVVSYSFIESLERMSKIITQLATEHCAGYPLVQQVEEQAQAVAAAGGVQAASGLLSTAGEIGSRDQAIELLRKVADYFHRTERHSPISYRIRETIRWCNMDLPELMQILLDGDTSTLGELQKRVGFLNTDDDDDD